MNEIDLPPQGYWSQLLILDEGKETHTRVKITKSIQISCGRSLLFTFRFYLFKYKEMYNDLLLKISSSKKTFNKQLIKNQGTPLQASWANPGADCGFAGANWFREFAHFGLRSHLDIYLSYGKNNQERCIGKVRYYKLTEIRLNNGNRQRTTLVTKVVEGFSTQ